MTIDTSADLALLQPEIADLQARYTDAVWRKDVAAFGACFCADGEWRISGRVMRGREEIERNMSGIMDRFERVLITFRTPLLGFAGEELVGRTYIDEQCSWKNGSRNMNLGRYYERFRQEDGRWRFAWRLFELHYRGPPDLTGTYYDHPELGPPPAMPLLDANTDDISSA